MTADALILVSLTALAHALGLAVAVALHRKLVDGARRAPRPRR